MEHNYIAFGIEVTDFYGYKHTLDNFTSAEQRDKAMAEIYRNHPYCHCRPLNYYTL
jgi:hypothetical protein